MLGHGGSSAGSYLADPTSPIPSHCAVYPASKCCSASIVVTSTVRVNILALDIFLIVQCRLLSDKPDWLYHLYYDTLRTIGLFIQCIKKYSNFKARFINYMTVMIHIASA